MGKQDESHSAAEFANYDGRYIYTSERDKEWTETGM